MEGWRSCSSGRFPMADRAACWTCWTTVSSRTALSIRTDLQSDPGATSHAVRNWATNSFGKLATTQTRKLAASNSSSNFRYSCEHDQRVCHRDQRNGIGLFNQHDSTDDIEARPPYVCNVPSRKDAAAGYHRAMTSASTPREVERSSHRENRWPTHPERCNRPMHGDRSVTRCRQKSPERGSGRTRRRRQTDGGRGTRCAG